MFQHVTPWKFNPQNQDCIYWAFLFLPEHFQHHWSPSWPWHQNITGIAQMPAAHQDIFGAKDVFWELSEGVRVSPSQGSPSPSLQGLCSCWRDGATSDWGDPWQIPVFSSLPLPNEQETPRAPHPASTLLPAPQIPREWAEFGGAGLSQPLPVPLGAAPLEEDKEPVQTLQLG